jgi:hypothetical protein
MIESVSDVLSLEDCGGAADKRWYACGKLEGEQ